MASATIDKSKGILGDSPYSSVMPSFIGIPYIPSIHNKHGVVPTEKDITSTLKSYISESKGNPRVLLTSLLFSCYQDLIVWLIAKVSRHISIPTREFPTIYHAIITGGYALRYYNQNHLTSDIDVKIFPEDSTLTERNEEFLQENIINYLQDILDKHVNNRILQQYLQYYMEHRLKPNVSLSEIADALSTLEYLQKGGMQMKVTFGQKYADETRSKFIPNKSVVKLLFSFTNDSKRMYKLADFAMYDKTDSKYDTLISKYYRSLHRRVTHIPPFIPINVSGEHVKIVTDNFMIFEKKYLTSLSSDSTTDRDRARWSKALVSLQQPYDKRVYKFLGGKKRHTKTRKMRNRKNKSYSKKQTSKRKLLSRHRKKSVKKMRKTRK